MNGVLNIYKPSGMTSFDVVRKIKKQCNTKKVGHTGTLDPMATGVLPICVGNATKIVDYIMNENKIYVATMKLGIITDTYDREGSILEEKLVDIGEEKVVECIKSFKGEIDQIPPMYSALKVNGKRLYELAREGIEIERKSRKINIYSIEILDINVPFVTFKVECSKGTYIRSLCYDIGQKLGVGGTMWSLERTKTGIFNIEDSVNIENLNKDNFGQHLIPIDQALTKYDSLKMDKRYEKLLLNGVTINNKYIIKDIEKDIIFRVYLEDKFIGLGRREEKGFKILKLLV
ncbi:tRNA pseudouridine55 synthase [Clostridium tetanomorphum]|uniref:tRNA pseudouridine synthase B n=1 Tax=Clostridium tetanomorphum TaxID=1553 RepID=A0A923ED36_CLOTT|nr:tRNA pseudouridine(55) synthase TruB [Clostridium tetanomorphum]KAJ51570.1 tRNA pseudouridine synthase B [Clostridium tetanomorphum DSM 665]MBC2398924.1 tRNA pseudouridine(55) synthase TruB [Clostridium tetanomorphum]MBP1865219.1 tRNA pseudouridine55 synthase [Clostridium tetanomorphum]NRS84642.1 tRNA pseudouridine55 synthase [Clostridium tetanomorphum]NRZ97857.1 tRNA pseudouridine55 synthase [Clostridium tetanomorphum]